MIAELVRYADSKGITGKEPFHSRPVHWFIDLDAAGNPLALTPTTKYTKGIKGTNLGEERGKKMQIPAGYQLGSSNGSDWVPDFLAGTADMIFPEGISGKNSRNDKPKKKDIISGNTISELQGYRKSGLKKLVEAASEKLPNNKALQSIRLFLQRATSLDKLPLPDILIKVGKDEDNADGDTLGFRVEGRSAFRDPELVAWWRDDGFQDAYFNQTNKYTESGEDAFQSGAGTITDSSPCIFRNVPIVSFGRTPFVSYGLDKNTARLRLDTVEKASAAIKALRTDETSSLSLGDQKAIFWAEQDGQVLDCSFVGLLDEADPLAVRDFLKSPWGGLSHGLDDASFHVAILMSGKGRFSLRFWGSSQLGTVKASFRDYFEAIRLPDGAPVALDKMASATIPPKTKSKPTARAYNALFEAAWQGKSIPHQLMAATVNRQALELAKGYDNANKADYFSRRKARTALLKLYFKTNHGIIMNEHTHESETNEAYLCGRVLALMDKIHDEAHGGSTASSPAGRFYGSASSTPALVFPRLCKLANIHLEKIGGGQAHKLQHGVPKDRAEVPLESDFEGLAQLIARFSANAGWPRTLSLEEQGRFAIGFYYEKCRKWPNYKPKTNSGGEENEPANESGSTPDATDES